MSKIRLLLLCLLFIAMSAAAAIAQSEDERPPRSDLLPPAAKHADPLAEARDRYPAAVADLEKLL